MTAPARTAKAKPKARQRTEGDAQPFNDEIRF
jgi:hypothetical protein